MKKGHVSAFDSGLRGNDKPKPKADAAKDGSSAQGPKTKVGNPDGEGADAYSSGMRGSEKRPGTDKVDPAVGDGAMQQAAGEAGAIDNSMERMGAGMGPEAHEDETHINIRVPKSAIKRHGAR